MNVLLAGLIAELTSQVMKIPFTYFRYGRWDWRMVKKSGGVPSSHTAFIVSGAAYIGFEYGISDPLFGVACIMASIIIYDALNVRYEAGKHATIINKEIISKLPDHEELYEDLGHTKEEVIFGVILGIVVGLFSSLMF